MPEFPTTQASLIQNVQAADNREAWEKFVAIYQPVIYRMARRRSLQDQDAQDVVQEVLVRVSSALDRYEQRPETRFRNWLGRVARNAIVTSLTRRPKDLGQGGSDAFDWFAEQPDAVMALDEETDRELNVEVQREQFHRAAAAVRSEVNAETWKAFELTVIDGMSCEEAAGSIGKSLGTIYAARSRIFKRLRQRIDLQKGEYE